MVVWTDPAKQDLKATVTTQVKKNEEMTENEIGKVVLVKLVLVNTGNGESTIAGSSLQLEPYVLYS